ncbi:hypothetical protein NIG5292_00746 [Nereida ignava]|uniref:Uncharacterized protein n=1 Tax=Nereida ignava TaxID=282199 RepID=A0A0U1NJ27_9RHOB|nr:hypothetical protein NIG5292_00746 [Nereida ignava]SFJ13278.1 hypothetical protein SAMN02745667_00409 [Nereida ignava DSM 16309]
MKRKGKAKVISSIVIGIVASIVVAAAYIRLAPVSVVRAPVPASLTVGEYPVAGGALCRAQSHECRGRISRDYVCTIGLAADAQSCGCTGYICDPKRALGVSGCDACLD